MEREKNARPTNSLLEQRLSSIERRLARIENKLNDTSAPTGIQRIPILGQLFTPRLWSYEQYSSRRLRIDHRYGAEKVPDNPLRFAIVTPTLNQARFIKATIDSVLQQNYPNLAISSRTADRSMAPRMFCRPLTIGCSGGASLILARARR